MFPVGALQCNFRESDFFFQRYYGPQSSSRYKYILSPSTILGVRMCDKSQAYERFFEKMFVCNGIAKIKGTLIRLVTWDLK